MFFTLSQHARYAQRIAFPVGRTALPEAHALLRGDMRALKRLPGTLGEL
jgi:hypothetical protein